MYRSHQEWDDPRPSHCHEGEHGKGLATHATNLTKRVTRLGISRGVGRSIQLANPGASVHEERKPTYPSKEMDPANIPHACWQVGHVESDGPKSSFDIMPLAFCLVKGNIFLNCPAGYSR